MRAVPFGLGEDRHGGIGLVAKAEETLSRQYLGASNKYAGGVFLLQSIFLAS